MGAREGNRVTLATGTEMPALGLGTWMLDGDEATPAVEHALEIGYRLIDTAVDYYNQPQIGTAPIPKAVDREHREENLDMFEFELDEPELRELAGLNEHYSSLAGLPYV